MPPDDGVHEGYKPIMGEKGGGRWVGFHYNGREHRESHGLQKALQPRGKGVTPSKTVQVRCKARGIPTHQDDLVPSEEEENFGDRCQGADHRIGLV